MKSLTTMKNKEEFIHELNKIKRGRAKSARNASQRVFGNQKNIREQAAWLKSEERHRRVKKNRTLI